MKLIKFILLWDQFPQIIMVAGSIPCIIAWIHGKATPLTGFVVGWNLGSSLYWQFCVFERKRKERWRDLAMRSGPNLDDMFQAAKGLVEARIRSKDIDADLN